MSSEMFTDPSYTMQVFIVFGFLLGVFVLSGKWFTKWLNRKSRLDD